MPPRVKAAAGLAGLVQSDSEPDLNDLDPNEFSPRDTARKDAATKKPRGRPPANKVTKPAQRQGWRVGSGASSPPASRQALKEKSTNPTRSSRAVVKQANATANAASAKPPQAKRGRPPKASKLVEVTSASNGSRVVNSPSKKSRGRGYAAAAIDEVEEDEMEDNEDPMEMDMEDEGANITRTEDSIPAALLETSPNHVPFGTASDDVSLRRRLGDATKRYENLESRHRELREVGIKEAERNVERIKQQAEENATAASELISELKAELAIKASLDSENQELQDQLDLNQTKCDGLQTKVADLMTSLSEARTEIKTLSTKLAAARTEMGAKVPGSALKPNSANARGAQAEYLHAAQEKEDLYGDLTGLIVRGVKHSGGETEFDCIQTGRNGTLHFKLALDTSDSSKDDQFTYRPQLDADRDSDLLDILPDYLVEEITFPRTHSSKFYSRVAKSLTERLNNDI